MKKRSKLYLSLVLLVGMVVNAAGALTRVLAQTETDATTGASEAMYDYTDPASLETSYDVIVIGAGGGGMAAAISAKEAGANVVIFEKMPIAGGNTMKSSAGMNASGTKFQEAEGIEDSNDLFFEETLAGGKETNDQELLRFFVDHSAPAID